MNEVVRWAAETGADPERVRAAIAFLRNDITGVASELALVDTGVVGEDDVTSSPANIVISRSLPARPAM